MTMTKAELVSIVGDKILFPAAGIFSDRGAGFPDFEGDLGKGERPDTDSAGLRILPVP